MTVANFIPTLWATSLLVNLHKRHVYGDPSVTNTDYEGEISGFGDRVKINSIGAVTVFDYTRNQDMPAPETLTDAQLELIVDQAKGFNFQIDDIDARQVKPKLMNGATQEAAFALADASDTFLAGLYVGATTHFGSTAAPVGPFTPAQAYEQLVDVGVSLDELNIPSEGRVAVVPPWFVGLIEKDDRFVKAGTGQSDATLRNGFAGSANGIEVRKSNNVPVVNDATAGDSYKSQGTPPAARSYA
jgi:N4-gp56 family major capsid protein